jgi:plasmid stabilization system protein ParE
MRFVVGSLHAYAKLERVKRYRFLREALEEYEDAVSYYERARSGLGVTFTDEVERVIALTLEFPDMGALVADTPHPSSVSGDDWCGVSTSRSTISCPARRSS